MSIEPWGMDSDDRGIWEFHGRRYTAQPLQVVVYRRSIVRPVTDRRWAAAPKATLALSSSRPDMTQGEIAGVVGEARAAVSGDGAPISMMGRGCRDAPIGA